MIEAYKIGASIILDTNITGQIGGIITEFERLNRAIKDAQISTKGLAADIVAMRRASAGIAELAKSFDKINTAAAKAATSTGGMSANMSGMSNHAKGVADHLERAERSANSIARAPRLLGYTPGGAVTGGGSGGRGGSGSGGGSEIVPYNGGPPLNYNGPGQSNGAGDPAMMGVLAAGTAASIWEAVSEIWKTGADVGAIKSRMLQAGFTPEQVSNALATATSAQQGIMGVTIPGAMEAQLDIATLIRNPDKAAAMLPELAGLGVVLGQQGKGGQIKELFEAVQSGELRGALVNEQGQMDPDKLRRFVREVEATSIATGGRIGPHEILGYLQNSGVAGRVIGDDALFGSLIPSMLSMDPKKAGTGLQAFYQQVGVGRISDATFNLMSEMGLIADPKKAEKVGIGQRRMNPGGLKGEDLVHDGNVMKYITDVLLPGIHEYNLKHYGKDDAALQATTAQAITSRIPGGKFLADVLSLLPLASAYQGAVGAATQRDALGIAQQTNPQLSAQGFTAAFQGFVLSLSDPNMEKAASAMRNMSGVLNILSDTAKLAPSIPSALGDEAVYVAGFAALLSVFALAKVAVKALGDMAPMVGQLFILGQAALAAYKGVGIMDDAATGAYDYFFPKHAKERADIKAYSPFDRSTWADPTSSWFNSGPKAPGVSGYTNGGLTPVYVVNHEQVGAAVSNGLASGASAPATGPTGFDFRMDAPLPGMGTQ